MLDPKLDLSRVLELLERWMQDEDHSEDGSVRSETRVLLSRIRATAEPKHVDCLAELQERAEAAEERERHAVRQVYAVNSRLRAEKAEAKSVSGEAVALLERWNKLSVPTCEELQRDTWDFLSRIRAEAPKENVNG